MSQHKRAENGYRSRMRTNNTRFACWAAAWLGATALMGVGPRIFWSGSPVFTLLAVGLDVVVGVGLIAASTKYVMDLDELQQKVYLNALGITVGVAVIASIPLSVMNRYQFIAFHVEISHLVILMSVTFAVSAVYGSVRYR